MFGYQNEVQRLEIITAEYERLRRLLRDLDARVEYVDRLIEGEREVPKDSRPSDDPPRE